LCTKDQTGVSGVYQSNVTISQTCFVYSFAKPGVFNVMLSTNYDGPVLRPLLSVDIDMWNSWTGSNGKNHI